MGDGAFFLPPPDGLGRAISYNCWVIPANVRPLFWDINPDTFHPKSYTRYTIGRILEWGDEQAFAWLKGLFSESEIRSVILSERRLSRRSANFWALVYGLNREEVAALATPGNPGKTHEDRRSW